MAAGVLPKPGTKFGPCKSKCAHPDCAETRSDAVTECSLCDKPIGYDTRFYRGKVNGLMHAACAEDEADRIAAARSNHP